MADFFFHLVLFLTFNLNSTNVLSDISSSYINRGQKPYLLNSSIFISSYGILNSQNSCIHLSTSRKKESQKRFPQNSFIELVKISKMHEPPSCDCDIICSQSQFGTGLEMELWFHSTTCIFVNRIQPSVMMMLMLHCFYVVSWLVKTK